MAGGMLLIALVRRQPPVLLAVSLAGWIVLIALDRLLILSAICGGSWPASSGAELAFVANPFGTVMLAWLAMLVAMMLPLLAAPIYHLRLRSLKRRRTRSIAEFMVGYGAVWFAAAPLIAAVVYFIRLAAAATTLPPFVIAALVALAWQATPAKQLCLNRCHRLPRLSAFGVAADLDCLRYGLTAGVWCVGSCWALMLLPPVTDALHLPLMAVIAMLIFVERARLAKPARWGFAIPAFLRKRDRSGPVDVSLRANIAGPAGS